MFESNGVLCHCLWLKYVQFPPLLFSLRLPRVGGPLDTFEDFYLIYSDHILLYAQSHILQYNRLYGHVWVSCDGYHAISIVLKWLILCILVPVHSLLVINTSIQQLKVM